MLEIDRIFSIADLYAPVYRVRSLESAIPFMKSLEDQYLPKARFEKELKELLAY